MGNLRRNPTSGRLLKHPTSGHLINGCPRIGASRWKLVPCAEGTSSCTGCSPAPDFITVVITGTSICTVCVEFATPAWVKLFDWESLNGTYLLPRIINGSCLWDAGFPMAGKIRSYDTVGCTGGLFASCNETEVKIRVRYNGTAWSVFAVPQDCTSVGTWQSLPVTADCPIQNVSCPANANSVCDTQFLLPWGGGTATVWAGDIDGGDRCSGGETYYTDTDLAAYSGKVVEISEAPDTCYLVLQNTDDELSDGNATVIHCWDTCQPCCDNDPTEC